MSCSSGVNILLANANSKGVTHAYSYLLWLARTYKAELQQRHVEQKDYTFAMFQAMFIWKHGWDNHLHTDFCTDPHLLYSAPEEIIMS